MQTLNHKDVLDSLSPLELEVVKNLRLIKRSVREDIRDLTGEYVRLFPATRVLAIVPPAS